MEDAERSKLVGRVVNSDQPLDAVKILNEIEPCERERVLLDAAKEKNRMTGGNPLYVITTEQSDGKRSNTLSVVSASVFQKFKMDLFKIEVPSDCK